jgi:ADP-ribose pyrophosphatase YjhB (NUDIX family)
MKEFKRSSGVIFKVKDEVLLCKRSPKKSLPNKWSIPSGGIEEEESPKDAAIREFKEETNIDLKNTLDLVSFINRYKKDQVTKKGIMYVFLYESNKKIMPDLEEAKDGFEHTECGYFTVKNLPINQDNEQLLKIIKKILTKD